MGEKNYGVKHKHILYKGLILQYGGFKPVQKSQSWKNKLNYDIILKETYMHKNYLYFYSAFVILEPYWA